MVESLNHSPKQKCPFGVVVATIAATVALLASAWAQTNPVPQPLPLTQDFGTTIFTTMPPGFTAWAGLSGGSISTASAAAASSPITDATVTAATTEKTTGGCYGFATAGNGRFYIQTSSNTANGANQLAMAIDTSGRTGVALSYDIEIVSAQPRTVGVVCQWRTGAAGPCTTLTASSGMNPFSQAAGTPGIKTTVNATLPAGADNQPVVQIRWALWRGSETGNSSGLAIDNIAVNATTLSNSIAITVTPDTVNESAGANAATVTVTTATPAATDLPVTLTSSDVTEAMIDTSTVVIPAGASTATFTVRAVDDDVVDGSQFVTLQASAPGGSAVTATLQVTDDEDPYSPPPGYYAAAGLAGSALKSALKTAITTGHVPVPYGDTFAPLRVLDVDPANPANIVAIYSGASVAKNDVYRPNASLDPDLTWSREHVLPSSFGLDPGDVNPGSTGGDAGPDYPDLHNLRPELQTVNSTRGNLFFDETSGTSVVPPLAPGCSRDTDSWEPREEYKGDLARVALYMATRYDGTDSNTMDLEIGDTPSTTTGRFARLATLLRWSEQDPVSTAERKRNHLVHGYQGNRNPFVDHPEYVALIWGGVRLDKLTAAVTEGGVADAYSITLASPPTADVTITVNPGSTGRVIAAPASLVFMSANWNIPQSVMVTANDDAIYQNTTTVTLSHTMTSADPRYATLAIPDVAVTVTDNDPEIPPLVLPLSYGGPWSPLPSGMLGSGVGTYATSLGGDAATGSCRFDDTNDRLVIAFSSSPGTLGYRLKGQPGSGTLTTGTFVIEESADGTAWSPVRTITNKSNADEAFSDTLLAGSRFVAFTYQNKVAGNLQLDVLTIGAATPGWQSWLSAIGLSGDAAGENADPDHDGLPNVVEYVLGSNPVNGANATAPAGSVAGSYLEFSFTRTDMSESDTALVVEWSSDLIVWNPIAVGATTAGMVQVDERGVEADLVTMSIPMVHAGTGGRLLARLKVMKP
jgi:hypothetical protein